MTAKQAAKRVRDQLHQLANGRALIRNDGERFEPFPPGLRFDARATPKGAINVTINEGYSDGYIDRVTDGDRSSWSYREHGQPVVDQVIAYEKFAWGKQLGKVEFGPVLISMTVGEGRTERIGTAEPAS